MPSHRARIAAAVRSLLLVALSMNDDAEGNRILTVQPDGTKVYTPFPEYEETITSGGTSTQRSNYYLAGQLIAVRVRTTGAGTLYYAYGDHLDSIAIWTYFGGTPICSSTARYEPYGGYRTTPTGGNSFISDRGFTGHKHNNTGMNDLGLIYTNARYYLPEIGRFISPDTIVPEPERPCAVPRSPMPQHPMRPIRLLQQPHLLLG